MKKLITVFLLFCVISNCYSQNTYDINFPQQNRSQLCNYFERLFQQKPKEVSFSIKQEGTKLFFEMNDRKFFNQMFKSSGDGIALDAVPKSRYTCDLTELNKSQIKGILLKPVYMRQLKASIKQLDKRRFRVLAGVLPETLANEEFEFNILFLHNKNLCRYNRLFNLASYPWDILDMGMYLDSLTFSSKKIKPVNDENYVVKFKTLKFEIPFEKNKSTYLKEDIKPMYDSLRLTDFNIKTIDINAYSSIEGSVENNIKLQEERAKSIAKAMQTFQQPTIVTTLNSSENWVEFFNDISNTKYSKLKTLSKRQIKDRVIGNLANELEVFLKNHRKAIVTLSLEKKDKYKNKSTQELIQMFNRVLAMADLELAKDIQNSIFQKLKENQTSPDEINKMSVPKQQKFKRFINKNSVNKFLLNQSYLLIAYNELQQLEKIVPNDKEVKYNLAVLKFNMWRYNAQPVNENNFLKEIKALKNYGIESELIDRMMVNYHIIKAERAFRKRAYDEKDQSVEYILNYYNKFPLSDYDYLSLAQFLSYYSNLEKAVELLDEKARSVSINEDLLFYYLNLTLTNDAVIYKSEYRTIMLNAININKEKFCKLFSAINKGGVTFQLLENNYLRETYCENCTN